MKAQFQSFWAARNPREQKVLIVWVATIVLASFYFGVLSPLMTRIPKLEKSLPRLEAQLFAMRAAPGSGPIKAKGTEDGDLRSALFKALAARQINADLRSITPERVELRLPPLAIADALSLANALRQDAGAQAPSVSIKNEGGNGQVLLVMELERK